MSFFNFLHLDYFLCLQVQVVTDFLFTKVIKAMAEADIGCACFQSYYLICLSTCTPTVSIEQQLICKVINSNDKCEKYDYKARLAEQFFEYINMFC